MKRILAGVIASVLVAAPALANVPWGTVQQVTGSTPSPTSFTSAPVLIDLMTGNTTMGALSGGTVGGTYTIIIEQDGTGSRTFTAPTNLTGLSVAEPAGVPSTANAYTVLTAILVGTNYVVQTAYDNASVNNGYTNTVTTLGTVIAPNVTQAQTTTAYVPGLTTSNVCICSPLALPATWQTGDFAQCVPTTNTATCEITNPTAATNTPTVNTLNVRVF